MKPNNFDKDIQQKFNSRTIEPSAQAWDRLDAMLTVAEEKKQPKNFFWLSIAATFLVFTGVGYIFFQQNQKSEILEPTNEVVISKETPINEIKNNVTEVENSENNEIITSPDVENELAITTPKTINSATKNISKQNNNSKYQSKLDSHQTTTEKIKEIIAKTENNSTTQDNNNENLKQVQIKKTTYDNVSPETLLAEVQGNEKSNGKTNTYKSTLKINPNDLLNSVETELNQSFKDKALTKLKQAKTVIVNRNYNLKP
jgi:hypothetical protein